MNILKDDYLNLFRASISKLFSFRVFTHILKYLSDNPFITSPRAKKILNNNKVECYHNGFREFDKKGFKFNEIAQQR